MRPTSLREDVVRASGPPAAARKRIVAALRAVFNFLVLNLVFVMACLPVVTVPLACQAAMISLERWRAAGEDRVVREFIAALRSRPPLRTTLSAGMPFVVAAIAVEEVHFFFRGGTAGDWVSLGFGVAALLGALASIGYVLLLGARHPLLAPTDLWYLSVQLAVRNVLLTGPLFVGEFAVAALLLLLNPALALIGVPLGWLCLLRATAGLGVRHSGFDRLQGT